MTREEIIDRMGWRETADRSMSDIITRIERIVRAAETAEREACARAAEQFGWSGECRHVAAAIRARGEP